MLALVRLQLQLLCYHYESYNNYCFQNYGINLFVSYHKCIQPLSPEDEGLIDVDVVSFSQNKDVPPGHSHLRIML